MVLKVFLFSFLQGSGDQKAWRIGGIEFESRGRVYTSGF